jgi:PPOX class probable F420-dependent enzyme
LNLARLSPEQTQLLSEASVGRLATASATGAPHVIPVCFASDGQYIYSVLDGKPKRAALTRLRRVRNLLDNPQVALLVDHYEADWSRLWYLLITGAAELLGENTEGEQREEAIGLLRRKYPQYRDMDIDGNPVIRITPQRVVSWGGGS